MIMESLELCGLSSFVELRVLSNVKLKMLFTFYKTSYPNEEISCTEPFASVSVPRIGYIK